MIDDGDLDAAVAAGVLDAATRERLVAFARDQRRGAVGPDEEQFRLLTGFNDIFVTVAVGLLLFAISSLGGRFGAPVGGALVAASSWGLAEYFTKVRRMALPSIVLLLTFVGGVFGTVTGLTTGAALSLGAGTSGYGIAVGAAAAAIGAYAHWRRFMVPITVAAGAAAVAGTVLATVASTGRIAPDLLLALLLVAGLAVFALAMAFDARDRARVTRWSDVAFWLHLLAAPAIVHPIFSLAGLLGNDPAPGAAAMVVAVYAVLTLVALAIDRRALLVSALGYVIFAVQSLVTSGIGISESFGLTALVLGLFLVLLSAAWRPIRGRVLALLPAGITDRLPVAAA